MPCLRGISGPRPSAASLIVSLLAAGCGSPSGPSASPTPTPTATPPPGPLAGRYLLQVVLDGNPGELELEFLSENLTLRGGLGTTGDGVLSNEATRLWMHAIGTGPVTRASDGRGEVATGNLMGYIALGRAFEDEGARGTCSARDHTFTLRTR